MTKDKDKTRAYLVLRDILLCDDFVKLEELADRHFVSMATMYRIFKESREILNEFDLEVDVRPNYGVRIEGSEMKRRACFSACWHFLISDEKASLIEQCGFPLEEAKNVEFLIRQVTEECSLGLTENIVENLAIHILYALKRIQSGEIVEPIIDIRKATGKELQAAQRLAEKIEKEFNVGIPDSELSYILLHLQYKDGINASPCPVSEQTEHLLKTILKGLKEEYLADYTEDQELHDLLAIHMESMLKRVQYGLHMPNPLLKEVKSSWPSAYECAVYAARKISDQFSIKVNEDELGFLALHFGLAAERKANITSESALLVVCNADPASARVLQKRLIEKYGVRPEQITFCSRLRLKNINLDSFDSIITTEPLQGVFTQPVYVIHNLLSDFQLHRQEVNSTYASILRPENILIFPKFKTRPEVIHGLSNLIQKDALAGDEIEELVIDREILASTEIGKMVAVSHPERPCTSRTTTAVALLKKPILWNGSPVKYVFMLSFGTEQLYDSISINEDLFSRITNDSFLKKMKDVETAEELISLFQQPVRDQLIDKTCSR